MNHEKTHNHGHHEPAGLEHADKLKHESGDYPYHHAHRVKDFRHRFWISLTITLPILILSPMIQDFSGITFLEFPGQMAEPAGLEHPSQYP